MGALDDLAKIIVAQNAEANQRIQAEDPYLLFKQAPDLATSLALGYATKEPGKFKTRDLITSALLSGLGSGISEGLSQDYQGRAKDAYTQAFLGSANGQPVERPQVLSPGLFRNAAEQGNLFKVQNIFGQAQRQQDLADAVDLAGAKKVAEIQGENAAYGYKPTAAPTAQAGAPAAPAAAVDLSTLNPNSPQYKAAKEIQDRQDSLEAQASNRLMSGAASTDYFNRQSNLKVLLSNLGNDSAAADLAIISAYQRVIDPGASVRGEDVRNISDAQGWLQRQFGSIKGWFSSEGRLKPEFRQQLAKAGIDAVNAQRGTYEDMVNAELSRVKDPSRVAYIKPQNFNLDDYPIAGLVATPTPATGAASPFNVAPDGMSFDEFKKWKEQLKNQPPVSKGGTPLG